MMHTSKDNGYLRFFQAIKRLFETIFLVRRLKILRIFTVAIESETNCRFFQLVEDTCAVKIQSLWRGYRLRKALSAKKSHKPP